jgi:hypothetical protein
MDALSPRYQNLLRRKMMKFVRFLMIDADKAEKMVQVSDKMWASPPPGIEVLTNVACLGLAFPGEPPNTIVSISIIEAESADTIAATSYPLMLAGGTMWTVPALDVPVGKATEVEKKARG